MDIKKKIAVAAVLIFSVLVCGRDTVFAASGRGETYSPPFELCGVVKAVNSDSLEVFIPHINKQVTVIVSPKTAIINRIDRESPYLLSAIGVEDLVVIKGIVDNDSLYSREISYVPEGK